MTLPQEPDHAKLRGSVTGERSVAANSTTCTLVPDRDDHVSIASTAVHVDASPRTASTTRMTTIRTPVGPHPFDLEPRYPYPPPSVWQFCSLRNGIIVSSLLLSTIIILLAVGIRHPPDIAPPHPRMQGTVRPRTISERSSYASGGINTAEYDTPFHVGALFLILFVSTMACAFPLLAARYPGLKIPGTFFFSVRHFGTGVLIATAFVHLLPTAFISLGNPCLGKFWNEDYPSMPGAITLAAIFFVSIIEMVFHPCRHALLVPSISPCSSRERDINNTQGMLVRDIASFRDRSTSIEQNYPTPETENEEEGFQEVPLNSVQPMRKESISSFQLRPLSPEQKQRKELLQCMLLELGILFHSVFIGMALSVSVGSDFIVLLIAIAFHQTFEGLALGARIAAITWPKGKLQPWLMALAYGSTVPLGQALGLATHTLYSPDSEVGLIMVGVMNAISAGLLTFASLVELLYEDFLSDESWKQLRGKKRVCACLLVFFGAFFMSFVGAWA